MIALNPLLIHLMKTSLISSVAQVANKGIGQKSIYIRKP